MKTFRPQPCRRNPSSFCTLAVLRHHRLLHYLKLTRHHFSAHSLCVVSSAIPLISSPSLNIVATSNLPSTMEIQASPSKARAYALDSHAWSQVVIWLSNLYQPSPLPRFERNAMTLKALQSLMVASIDADQTRRLLFEARCEELELAREDNARWARVRDDNGAIFLLDLLGKSLSQPADEALLSLANSAVQLGGHRAQSPISSTVVQDIQRHILNLPVQNFALDDQLSSIEKLTTAIQHRLTQTRQDLEAFQRRTNTASVHDHEHDDHINSPPPLTPPHPTSSADHSALHAQTLQHQRETNQLQLKSAEYRSRIHALEKQLSRSKSDTDAPTPSLAAKQQSLESKMNHVASLETKIKGFHGLPPDIDASRAEVQRAQVELESLRIRRDEIFRSM